MGIDLPEVITQNVGEIARRIKHRGAWHTAFVWGSPGIGKTDSIGEEFHDHEIELVLAGTSEPTDIAGIPFEFMWEGKPVATEIKPPIWAWKASTVAPDQFLGPRLIFCDDLPTGPPQTQAAFFKMCGEKKVGNLFLRDNVHVIGAGNSTEHKSGAFEMPLALGNRMVHYFAESNTDEWIKWALKTKTHPIVIAYIRARPDMLDQFAKHIASGSDDPVFATPRSWALLSRIMLAEEPSGALGGWLDAAVQGCVGRAAYPGFTTFANTATKLVPPEDIVNDPYNAKIPPADEIDVLHATVAALEHYINQKKNYKHWINAVRYVLRDGIEVEFGVLVARLAIVIAFDKLGAKGRTAAIQTPEFQQMHEVFGIGLTTGESQDDE